ncbi:MAG: hypothetical protein J6T73_07045, partial [Clostridia bacterium]|nr:hypothetical protein [Clostridia bacterium]
MKKITVLILALVSVTVLVSCSGSKSGESSAAAAGTGNVRVMSYAEYSAAALDTPVTVETYIQGRQSWWEGKATLYTQSEDGAYFIYQMPCTAKEFETLTVGTKIRVSGKKSEWSGEIEIADATFEILDGKFIAEPLDVTALIGTDKLAAHQNELVKFENMTVEAKTDAAGNEVAFLYNWDGSGEEGDDLYFDASVNGNKVTFTVESYLCGPDT